MTPEIYHPVMTTIYLNIATSVVNIITTCLLIYGTIQLRKASRIYREAAERFRKD